MGIDNFFQEWSDKNITLQSLSVLLSLSMFLILLWVTVNIPQELGRAIIFIILVLTGGIFAAIDIIKENNKYLSFVDYGKTWKNFGISLLTGEILSLILYVFGLISNFSLLPTFAISGGAIGFLYVVIAASYCEEKFWRGFLNPTFGRIFKNFKIPLPFFFGIVVSSFTFGIFHYIAYGGVLQSMIFAFVFGLIVSVGNYYFKSRGFGLSLHVLNNFFAVGGFTALIGLI